MKPTLSERQDADLLWCAITLTGSNNTSGAKCFETVTDEAMSLIVSLAPPGMNLAMVGRASTCFARSEAGNPKSLANSATPEEGEDE